MTRKVISILLILMTVQVWADPIDQQQAVQNVKAFLNTQSRKGVKGIRAITQRNKEIVMEKAAEVADAYFVFNIQGGGFVIAAADDRVPAVLGYADSGSFDMQEIPDNMRGWLEGMTAEIQAVQQEKGEGVENAKATRESIAPMITTKWRQGSTSGNAYNYQCPTISNLYCLTGCVATAMAQLMKYHEWPKTTCQTIPSYESTKEYSKKTVGTLPSLPGVVFDWANMKNTYSNESSTDASAKAVAQLMRYCGQSVEMQYSPSASSASTSDMSGALKRYFDYDEGTRTEYRAGYTIEQWNEMVYQELAEKRPVVLSGSSSGGGHAFICDGYDADDYFHINWGWGGSSDGCFLLSVLNPYDNSGSGASSTRDGYSASNYAIVGAQPPTGNPYTPLFKMTAVDLSASGTYITCNIKNRTGEQHVFDLGYATKTENGDYNILYSYTNRDLKAGQGYSGFKYDLSNANLADGTYYIYVVSKESSSTTWLLSNAYYFTVVVKNGKISITVPSSILSFERYTLLSDGKSGLPQELSVTIDNSGDKEFYDRLYLFIEGTSTYMASTGSTISPGKQSDISFFFTPTAGGTFRFWICTDSKGENKIGEGTVTFTEAEKQVYVKLTPLNMNTVNDVNYMTTTAFRAQLMIFNNTDSEQQVALYTTIKGPDKNGAWDRSYTVAAGKTQTVTYTSTLTEGNTYTLTVYKDKTKTDTWQAPITFTVSTSTGIQSVADTTPEKEPVFYDLQGRRVDHPTKGIYIVNKKKVIIK